MHGSEFTVTGARLLSGSVRFATWNCCSGGAAKVSHLERAGVDVAVICEAPLVNPRASETLLDRELSWLAVGTLSSKGLALAGFTQSLTGTGASAGEGRWTISAVPEHGPTVLGIWSCPAEKGAAAYGAQVIRSLDAHAERIVLGDVIVAGDFNVGQGISGVTSKDWTATVRERWESLGLVSVYHSYFAEPLGQATRATYFHQRHLDRGFHIDYVLLHESRLECVKRVVVGDFDKWVASGLSDHVPIFVDLDWEV